MHLQGNWLLLRKGSLSRNELISIETLKMKSKENKDKNKRGFPTVGQGQNVYIYHKGNKYLMGENEMNRNMFKMS